MATEYFARVGQPAEAFAALDSLAELPFVDLLWMDLCPALEPLRPDPRFARARDDRRSRRHALDVTAPRLRAGASPRRAVDAARAPSG